MVSSERNLILSVNAGSSSLKIALYSVEDNSSPDSVQLVLTSSISNISSPPAKFSLHLFSTEPTSSNLDENCDAIHDHESGFSRFLDALKTQASVDNKRVIYICHRVVHGGDYNEPILITQESYDHIERLSDLAPL
jgi:acetate kinase